VTSLVELGYGLGWSVVKALPRSVVWPVFRAGADRSFHGNGPSTQRLRRNLRHVVGPDMSETDLDLLVREGLRSYARYWLESFQLPRYSPRELDRLFHLENAFRLEEAVTSGTGCVVALGHSGNWDLGGAWVCTQGWPLTTVAERLKPEGLYRKFLAYRNSLGMEIIPTVGGERAPLEILTERVNAGRVVPLLADRDLSARGVEVRFFGGRTRMPAGPAMLALRTGAPLYVVSLWYEGDRSCGIVKGPLVVPTEGPLDVRVRSITQTIADLLAEHIAEYPQDWHMLQRMWLSEPAGSGGRGPEPAGSGGDGSEDRGSEPATSSAG
jgi:KDO2-lipid IV(A) lauroyltransferase